MTIPYFVNPSFLVFVEAHSITQHSSSFDKEVHPRKCLTFCNKNAIKTAIQTCIVISFPPARGEPTKPYQSRPS